MKSISFYVIYFILTNYKIILLKKNTKVYMFCNKQIYDAKFITSSQDKTRQVGLSNIIQVNTYRTK